MSRSGPTDKEAAPCATLHYLSGKVIKLKDPQIVKQFDALDKNKPEPAKGE